MHARRVCTASNEGRSPPSRHRPGNGLEDRRRAPFLRSISLSNHTLNINSHLQASIHAIRACATWAHTLAHRLVGRGNATYLHQHRNHRICHKSVISRIFAAPCESFRLAVGRHCGPVNRSLPMPCVLRLAASQHRNFRSASLSPIFISTMTPGQGLNQTTGDYQCCSRSSA